MTACPEWGVAQYLYSQPGSCKCDHAWGQSANEWRELMHGHSAEPDWSVKYRTTHPKLKQQKPTHDDVIKTWQDIIMPTTTINQQQQMNQTENKMVDTWQGWKWHDMKWMWNKMEQMWLNKTKQIQHSLQLKTWARGIRSDLNINNSKSYYTNTLKFINIFTCECASTPHTHPHKRKVPLPLSFSPISDTGKGIIPFIPYSTYTHSLGHHTLQYTNSHNSHTWERHHTSNVQ